MTTDSWALTDDLPYAAVIAWLAVSVITLVVTALELKHRERHGLLIGVSGLAAAVLVGAAALRPLHVRRHAVNAGPRVIVLVDQSRRMLLPQGDGTRWQRAQAAVAELRRRYRGTRFEVLGFAEGPAKPMASGPAVELEVSGSDLVAALEGPAVVERPEAVVVVSDGRLVRPGPEDDLQSTRSLFGRTDVPLHSVRVTDRTPADASIRSVRAAGAAVAHQSVEVTIEVGCAGGIECDRVPVTVRELRQQREPSLLASGNVEVRDGIGRVKLPITLERAGSRVVEVSIETPPGDVIPENDTRLITFAVSRDRVRLLHVAGRPTYDVRALRVWLKSDRALDVVTFFILRTLDDDARVSSDEDELALIPFPVHELFTEHLASFDAVILQDIDAVQYEIAPHLHAIAEYVHRGGGLIMVGGASAFLGGSYGASALEAVLPSDLPQGAEPFDTARFVPRVTTVGRVAPVLRPLRELLDDRLPEMVGSNTLGAPREGALVLWEHPTRRTSAHGAEVAMPILSLMEAGDGRSVALGVDGTYRLVFSELGATVEGRAYAALYDGLLGWLMRDPRYESARIELDKSCVAGVAPELIVHGAPGLSGDIRLVVRTLGRESKTVFETKVSPQGTGRNVVSLGRLESGGYSIELRMGRAPPTRHDFACEAAGESWSDSRPDPERLERIAKATGGRSVSLGDVGALPMPRATEVSAERQTRPMLPAWAWSLAAAGMLATSWLARRRGGLR